MSDPRSDSRDGPRDDLERLELLFQAAADLPRDERAAFLDEHCDDPELRRRAEALLAAHERGDSLGAAVPERAGAEDALSEGPGTRIGRYKLLQKIGEGGFGVVYMAEQEEPIRRKVALKIIKLGMDTREVVARFEAERQALALMDHPNIARVLDGGATETGRPYFVMELVRGVAITEYADRDRLATRERLELFVDVCQAVQHAHQKGVIHRDLKPSNVLVTMNDGRPMPKVIDFGIAKAMHTRLTEKTLFTQFQRFIGTPAYMSPEQAELSALDVDTRTDIYSLGVLLYELLTGSTPFDTSTLLQAGLSEVQRVIREQQPERPSLRISTSGDAALASRRADDVNGLARALRGDLDWIVMRCLEKERSRRYSTASELAADLQRHLDAQPVLAGPPSALYRLRKLAARNRVAVVSGAAVLLALLGGLAATGLALREAERQRDDALDAREEALAERNAALGVTGFLVDTLALADPGVALAPDVPVRTMLDRAAERVPDAFADQPWAEARVRATIGRAYQTMGEQLLAEPHLRRALELYRSPDWESDERFPPAEVFDTAWAMTHLCFNLERPDAFEMAELSRRVALRYIGARHPDTAVALRRLTDSSLETDEERLAEVPRLFEESVRVSDRDLAPDDPLWRIVAEMYAWSGYSFWYSPDEAVSAPIWRRAYEIQRRVLPDGDPRPGETLGQLVTVLNRAGRAEEAEAELRQGIASMRRALGDDAYQVAFCESMLGESLVEQGRYAEAEPLLLASHAVLERQHRPTGFMTVDSLSRLARLYEAWGRPDERRRWGQAIVDATVLGAMAMPWPIARHAFAGTDPAFQEALARVAELVGEGALPEVDDPALADAIGEVLALREGALAGDRDRAAVLGRYLALWSTRIAPGELDETCRATTVAALEVLRPLEERFPLDVAALLARQASLEDDPGRARELAGEAWQVVRRMPEDCDWYTVMARTRIARALADAGLVDEALAILRPGRRVLERQLGPDNSLTREVDGLVAELERRPAAAPDARGN